jgi:hypothetical protein
MSTEIHQLLYCSHLCSPRQNRRAELNDILVIARRNNARVGITGGLFVLGDIVVQMLEGPTDHTERVFETICADPRHRDVTLLRRRDVARRTFPTWAMGFEITEDAPEEVWTVLAQSFSVQNDEMADAITDLIKDGAVRIEM